MIYSVVCTDLSRFVGWQCELLEYTWERAAQPGELVRVVTAPEGAALPRHRHARVLRNTPEPARTRGYKAFERLFALAAWLRAERPDGTVLVLDPDCVFRRAVAQEVTPGAPRAQHWVDFPSRTKVPQAATWPMLIHTRDLEALLPRWIAFTGAIHAATHRWESDMYGLVAAAAAAGLRFSLEAIGAYVGWPDELVGEAPIVHYCQDVVAGDGDLLWSKRSYRPWAHVAGAERARHAYCRDLLVLVNEHAVNRRDPRERAEHPDVGAGASEAGSGRFRSGGTEPPATRPASHPSSLPAEHAGIRPPRLLRESGVLTRPEQVERIAMDGILAHLRIEQAGEPPGHAPLPRRGARGQPRCGAAAALPGSTQRPRQ